MASIEGSASLISAMGGVASDFVGALGDRADLLRQVTVLVAEVRLGGGERRQERGGVIVAERFAESGGPLLCHRAESMQGADLPGEFA